MYIKSKRVWIANGFMPAIIKIENDKITAILEYDSNIDVDVDYQNKRIVPGFFDVHTHGAYGYDVNNDDYDGLKNWLKRIPEEGVTAICPTTVTQSREVLNTALKNVAKVYQDGYEGAEIVGINMEGPCLDTVYKGAQPLQHIIKPNIELMQEFLTSSNGLLKIVTIAPEHDDDYQTTAWLAKHNIIPSVGHSSATFHQTQMAVAHGAKLMTHVYNGMTPYNHRNLGQVGAAFRFRDMFGEIIVDGIHSLPPAINVYFTNKGADYPIIVSDSLSAKGIGKGKYTLGGNEIEIYDDGSAHRMDGGLAGSTLRINEGLRICVEEALVPFAAALNACTINPARLLGLDNRKGKICVNYDADMVVLNDDYTVAQTYARGIACIK